jgi:hypothetical protein
VSKLNDFLMNDFGFNEEHTTPGGLIIPVPPEPEVLTPDPELGAAMMGDPEAGDPFIEMGEGMRPLPESTDRDRLIAAYDLVGRVGAVDFVVGYDDDLPEEYWWFARAALPGGSMISEVKGCTGADVAAEKLARKICNGGRCTACGKVMSLLTGSTTSSLLDLCFWTRTANPKRWERGCVDTHEENEAQIKALEMGQ